MSNKWDLCVQMGTFTLRMELSCIMLKKNSHGMSMGNMERGDDGSNSDVYK